MITVAFRLDDPSETSNQKVEAGILDALRANRACCTFAVIPFRLVDGKRIPLSAERARPLVDAAREGAIEPALHGFVHVRTHPETPPSEFVGRSYEDQQSMIREGRAHLESVFGKPERKAGVSFTSVLVSPRSVHAAHESPPTERALKA